MDSQSFITMVELYDKFRSEYPYQLVNSAIELRRLREGSWILEISSGTGKATRLFARRGFSIHCIELGQNPAAMAARILEGYPQITIEVTCF